MDQSKNRGPRRLDGPMRSPLGSPNLAKPPNSELPGTTLNKGPRYVSPISPAELNQTAKPVFKYRKPQKRRWPVKRIGFVALGLTIAFVAFFGLKLVLATSKIISRNSGEGAPALAGNIDPTKLKGEGDGRINILLLGIGGAKHAGGNLTDTMMVMSIDPRTKEVAMLSIPRDLYVPIRGFGSTKINAAHAYGEINKGGGPALAKETVAKALDIPIHYYIRLDFDGFRKAVDRVGGIDMTIDNNLSDSSYPCDNDRGVCPFTLSAGSHHLDGALALKVVRCREGTCGTNFGREKRQQQAMVALRQKALSLSTLTNPANFSSLIDIMGDHLKTDLQLPEIKKLALMAKDIDTSKIIQKGLGDYVVNDSVNGASVVVPKSGNFTEIREFVHSIFVDNYLKDEAATIEVQNGTTRNGLANSVGATLKNYNYNVVKMVTADNQNYLVTKIFDYSGGKKPYTVKYLENRFKAKAQRVAAVPSSDGNAADIKIIVGADYRAP